MAKFCGLSLNFVRLCLPIPLASMVWKNLVFSKVGT